MRLRTAIPSLRTLGLAVLLIGAVCAPTRANAQLLDFDFSFDGTPNHPGTVSGEIIGLEDNSTSLPTEIIIDSAPAGLGFTLPYTFDSPNVGGTGFTVSGGEITAQDYSDVNAGNVIHFGSPGNNDYLLNNQLDEVSNVGGGLAAVTYTPVSSTPEPPGLFLLGTGLLALAAASAFRSQPWRSPR